MHSTREAICVPLDLITVGLFNFAKLYLFQCYVDIISVAALLVVSSCSPSVYNASDKMKPQFKMAVIWLEIRICSNSLTALRQSCTIDSPSVRRIKSMHFFVKTFYNSFHVFVANPCGWRAFPKHEPRSKLINGNV